MLRIITGSVALSLLVHGVAWACSCIPDERTPEQLLSDYPLVAWGTVRPAAERSSGCGSGAPAEIHSDLGSRTLRLEVEEGFVGAGPGEVVDFQVPNNTCGVDIEPGQRWLILTSPTEGVSICNPSRPATDGDPLLGAFREIAASE